MIYLNSTNYRDWALVTEIILKSKDVVAWVNGTKEKENKDRQIAKAKDAGGTAASREEEEEEEEEKAWDNGDCTAKLILVHSVNTDQLAYIKEGDSAFKIWETYRVIYGGSPQARLAQVLESHTKGIKALSVTDKAQLLAQINTEIRN